MYAKFYSVIWVLLGMCLVINLSCAPRPLYRSKGNENQKNRSRQNGLYKIEGGELQELFQVINSYLGVPYRWGGTSRKGMDCSGFVSVVFREVFQLNLPHSARKIFRLGYPLTWHQLQPGDLVFFRDIESQGVSHVGIYLGEGKFAHASVTRGVVISHLNEDYYRTRFVGGRKILIFKKE